jgi:hypothetical protein
MPRHWDNARSAALFVAIVWATALADAQTLAGLQGRVFDASGAAGIGSIRHERQRSVRSLSHDEPIRRP